MDISLSDVLQCVPPVDEELQHQTVDKDTVCLHSDVCSSDLTWRSINATAMFRCRPDIVKNLFVVSSTNNADDDQLYVGMVNMCYATRNLSRYGLPYSN